MMGLGRVAAVAMTICALTAMLGINVLAAGTAEPDVVAASAIVVDLSTGEVLYDKSSIEQRAPASLTKLFTALIALESASPDTLMPVAESDLVGEASMGLYAGESLPFETLLYGLLLPSGNDAAMTIARNVGDGSVEQFVADTNARLAELGLTGTHLANPHGLDQDDHYSTARDIALATIYAIEHEPLFAEIAGSVSFERDGHALYQTNDLHTTYPGLIAGKTGVTDLAGNCLMEVAERDGQRVLVVLLGSTSDAWYSDAEALLDYGFATLAAPGRLQSFDHLQVATVPVAAPAAASEQSPAGLTVVPENDQTSVVQALQHTSSSRRPSWVWPVTAVVGIPVLLAFALRVQQLVASALAQSRTARRHPTRRTRVSQPAARIAVASSQSHEFTAELQPFAANSWNGDYDEMGSQQHGFTTELPVVQPRVNRERTAHPRIGLPLPSFSGD